MEFATYWSILDTPSNTIKSSTIGLVIFFLGILLWIVIKKFKKDSGDGDRIIILFGTALFSILGLLLFVLTTFICVENTDKVIAEMLNSSKTSNVEGYIENFERSYRNHKAGRETTESFSVANVKFSYSDALLSKFGDYTKTYDEKIFEGQYVRITYYPDTENKIEYHKILKIELGKPKATNTPPHFLPSRTEKQYIQIKIEDLRNAYKNHDCWLFQLYLYRKFGNIRNAKIFELLNGSWGYESRQSTNNPNNKNEKYGTTY